MRLKEIANKNAAWNSVQHHLFHQTDAKKYKRATLGMCRVSESIVDEKADADNKQLCIQEMGETDFIIIICILIWRKF